MVSFKANDIYNKSKIITNNFENENKKKQVSINYEDPYLNKKKNYF